MRILLPLLLLAIQLLAGDPGNPAGGNCQILEGPYFTICHDNANKLPKWVAFRLTRENLRGTAGRQGEKFYPDPRLKPGTRSELADYRRSGFDRGHMAPASSFRRDRDAMHATFSLANMSPQTPELNREMWRMLEDCVRALAEAHGDVQVVVGCNVAPRHRTIGPNRVAVPADCWQVLYCDHPGTAQDEIFAFSMPNVRRRLEGDPNDYAVPAALIEAQTGLDFFPALDLKTSGRLEYRTLLLPEEALKWRPPITK